MHRQRAFAYAFDFQPQWEAWLQGEYTFYCRLHQQQTVAGTDALPVVADDSILAFNVSITIEADEQARSPDKGYYSADEKTYTNKRVSLSFDIEMAGSGTVDVPPAIAPVLLMCQLAETINAATSVVYAPVSGSTETATIYMEIDDVLYKVLGAKGSLSVDPAIKSYNKASVTATGLYLTPVDTDVGTPVFTDFNEPLECSEANSELLVNAVAVDGVSFSYDLGQDNQIRESTETKQIANLNRQGSGEITCWMNDLSAFNPYTLYDAHTKVPIKWTTGLVAGSIIEYDLAAALLGSPQPTDLEGVAGYTIPLTPYSTGAGDNEFTITFK